MKALVFAGILSIAAASAVQAGGHSTSGDFHANAVPACDTEKCPMLAGDTGPGGPGDDNGRSQASNMAGEWHPVLAGGKPTGSDFHASASPICDTDKCPVLATDGPPTGVGSGNGRSSAFLTNTARSGQIPRLWHPVLADNGSAGGMNDDNGGRTEGGRGGIGGEV